MTPEQEASLRAQVARETVGGFRRTIDPLPTAPSVPVKTVGQAIVHRPGNDLPPGVPDYNRGPIANPSASPTVPPNSPATSKIQQLLDSSRAKLSSWLGLSAAGNLSTAPQLGGGAGTQPLSLSPDQVQGSSPITNALGLRNLSANPQGASVIPNRTKDLESGLDALQQRSTQLSKSPTPAIEGQTGMASAAPATSPVFDMRANLISAAQPPAKQAQAPA